MKRLFIERSRLVVYLESSDLQRLTEQARSEGKALVEWARETLLGELENNSDVPRPRRVRVAERGIGAPERPETLVSVASGHGKCEHRKAKGELCYKCDPKFGLPAIEEASHA